MRPNPALVEILGADSDSGGRDFWAENVEQFYVNRRQRDDLLATLRSQGEAKAFDCNFRRLDGLLRQVVSQCPGPKGS